MKKFLSILFLALTAVVGVYAQETSSKKNFAEVGGVMMQGLGEFDNFTYWGGGLSLGHYFTPIWGVSVEGKVVFRHYEDEGDKADGVLGFVGVNGHAKVSELFMPNSILEIEPTVGIGYSWIHENSEWTEEMHEEVNLVKKNKTWHFIVPKVGVNVALNLTKSRNLQFIVTPELAFYKNKDVRNDGFTNLNVNAKLRLKF
ncbi:hypothetical protein [Prevotella sp.]|uniref:hypothetical protein n=1 Tax=Prevotella sp. TaxID=59823 RepID=UPI002F9453AD